MLFIIYNFTINNLFFYCFIFMILICIISIFLSSPLPTLSSPPPHSASNAWNIILPQARDYTEYQALVKKDKRFDNEMRKFKEIKNEVCSVV